MHTNSAVYSKLEKLGEGTYATVYKGIDTRTNRFVALKEIRLSPEEGAPSTALREISLMRELEHPNIMRLLDVIHGENTLTLVFEYLAYDLRKYLDITGESELDLPRIKSLLFQLLLGIRECHKKKILHRDLKPHNLLLSKEGLLKIGDFGLARISGIPVPGYSSEVVTLWYRAPDILLGSTFYDFAIDMWSVGCIMAELYTKKPLLSGKNKEDQLLKIFAMLGNENYREQWNQLCGLWTLNPKASRCPITVSQILRPTALAILVPNACFEGLDLLRRFLCFHPQDRISAEAALSHPYFEGMHE